MRVSLNLATRPFADLGPILRRLWIAMGALALAAVALGIGLYILDQKAKDARVRDEALSAQIARVNRERQGYQAMMRQPQNAAVLAQAQNLNQLFDAKSFSWTLAMEDLETVLPSGVQVTTLEPIRDKDGHITLRLRVLGPRDRSIQLVQNLEHSKRFVRPRIVGESSEASSGPNQAMEPVSASNRVNFELLADYNPAPPGTRGSTVLKAQAPESAAQPPARMSTPTPPGAHRPPYTGMRPTAPHQPHIGVPQ
jgi:type IV pilus assembly protein PilN